MKKKLKIDETYMQSILKALLQIPSPSGYTDSIVHYVCKELNALDIKTEVTRRGAIRAHLDGKQKSPDRAIVAHVDTLGAMVRGLKPNGRLEVAPIGTWSSRFAEGARVTIFSEEGSWHRGTILPLKASGHTYNEEIDSQPVSWDNVEIRVDIASENRADTEKAGIAIGDFVAIDPNSEFLENGFVSSRHLDNKAGVALLLTAAKAVKESKVELPVDCHLLFTISEEVGSGASHILHQDVAEILSIDNSTIAPGQNSMEAGVTIAMMDSTGPFDFHFTQKLISLCKDNNIPFARDVFRHYRCDAASAVEAGNDLRTALICFGCDASHGYERTHMKSLVALAELLSLYVQSTPTFSRDENQLSSIEGFSEQPIEKFSVQSFDK